MLAHAEMSKRLEGSGVLSTRSMKKLSEKKKLIQEQSRVIVEKEKEIKENMAAVKKREQEYELDHQNREFDAAACDDVKKYLNSCKSGIYFHKFRHNNIKILNFNFKILASHFFLFVECLIVNVVE